MILIFPGEETDWIRLSDCLLSIYVDDLEIASAEIEKRKKNNTPLDDMTDWQDAKKIAASLSDAVDKMDPFKAQETARIAIERIGASAIRLPTKPANLEEFQDIYVKIRAIDDASRRRKMAAMAQLYADARKTEQADPGIVEIDEKAIALQQEFMQMCLAGIRGMQNQSGIEIKLEDPEAIAKALPALRKAGGVFSALFSVCRHYQDLPAKKAACFGLPQPSTSVQTSIAQTAQSQNGKSLAALGAVTSTSKEQNTKPIAAPVVI